MEGAFIIFLLFLTAAAVWCAVWQASLRAEVEQQTALERQIIRVALQRNGRITALDVATRGPEGVEVIEKCLRRLQRDGYCDSELTADGHHIYIFQSFDDAPFRARAIEKEILRLAKIHNGVVKTSDVALITELSYREAHQWLDMMVIQKICQVSADIPEGYLFPEMTVEQIQPNTSELGPVLQFELPAIPGEAESPFALYSSDANEAVDFIYDKSEENRTRQPRLPQKSGG